MCAVVTRQPEDHGMTAEGVEADFLRGAALGSGDDQSGVQGVAHRCPVDYPYILQQKGGAAAP